MKYAGGGVHPVLGLTIKRLILCPKGFSDALLLTQMLVTKVLMSTVKKL